MNGRTVERVKTLWGKLKPKDLITVGTLVGVVIIFQAEIPACTSGGGGTPVPALENPKPASTSDQWVQLPDTTATPQSDWTVSGNK